MDRLQDNEGVSEWLSENWPKIGAGATWFVIGFLTAIALVPNVIRTEGRNLISGPARVAPELALSAAVATFRDPMMDSDARVNAASTLVRGKNLSTGELMSFLTAEEDDKVAALLVEEARKRPATYTWIRETSEKKKFLRKERIRVAEVLSGTNDEQFLRLVMKFSYDGLAEVRVAAYSALAASDSPRAARILLTRRIYETDPKVRAVIDQALTAKGENQVAVKNLFGR